MTAVPVEGEKSDVATEQDPARTPDGHAAETPKPVPDPRTGSAPERGSVPDPAVDSAPEPEPEPASDPVAESAPESLSVGASERESESGAEPGPAAESVPGTRTVADPEPGSEADSGGPGQESVPEPAAESVPEPEPVSGSEPVAESAPESQSVGASERESESGAEPGPAAESVPGTRTVADSESEPGSGRESGLERGPGLEPVAESADGLGSQPAGGTGETASDSDRESRSESQSESRSVPESDSERTSTFIRLKPLGEAPSSAASSVRGPVPGTTPLATPATAPAAAPASAPGGTPARGQGPGPIPGQGPRPVLEWTAEQPLPPLDLLAQLTNTPPPPETRGRTVARRVRVWVPLLLLLVAVLAVVQALRPLPAPVLARGDAATAFTLDGRFDVPWPEKGQAALRIGGAGDVGTFGEQKPVPTASVAKVMTAYVILKGHPLKKDEAGPQIEIDAKAVADGTSENESRIEGLKTGTRFTQQDMLKMLMIPSGNNIARLLARWDTASDSEAAFVEKMNAAARELGMDSTTYTDPSGLDAKTVSTAVDQLKLAEAVMRIDAFRAIVQLPSASVPGLSKQLINNNDLLVSPLSIKGIKTGSSTPAGGTLMWAAYKTVGDKTPLILGTMLDQHVTGADPNGANSLILVKDNSKKVIEAVRTALTSASVVKEGQVVGYVDDGLGTRTPVVATKDTTVAAVPGQQVELVLAVREKGLPREARAGTEIGTLTIGTGPGTQTVPVALQKDLSEPSLGAKLMRVG
ncbi:D-alanyl-D-alanine carboxypeptidase [Streptomyces sp. NBC_00435]|uniref:D-alanyl-D-alanine carboxypeptidase n=1 Tax=Streptomyces sp. NBC_00435 TaxID=2903649 RepID=UPI002E1CB221